METDKEKIKRVMKEIDDKFKGKTIVVKKGEPRLPRCTYAEDRAKTLSILSTGSEDNWTDFIERDT